MREKQSRRAASERLVPVTVKIPVSLFDRMEAAIAGQDTDRSKFTRAAIRNHMGDYGAQQPAAASAN